MYESWQRQKGETDKAWKAFKAYLDSDERKVGYIHSHRNWSMKWSWRDRAREYDQYIQQQVVEREIRYRMKMNDKQRREGALMQNLGVQRLAELNPGTLSATEARQFLEIGAKIERLAAGANTEQTSTSTTVSGRIELEEISRMGAEEVETALRGLQQEIAGRTGVQLPTSYQEPAITEAEVIDGDLSASDSGEGQTPQVEQNLSDRPDSGLDTEVSEDITPDPEPEPAEDTQVSDGSDAPSNVAPIHRGHNPHPGLSPWTETTGTAKLYDDVL